MPFLHWLPKPLFDSCLGLIGKPWAAGDYMYLLFFDAIKSLLHEAEITDYSITRNMFLGFCMDFSIAMRF